MKKYVILSIIAIVMLFVSCKKNNTVNDPIEGKWSVISFVDNGTDKSSQFASYDFSFDNNGNLIVNGGGMMSMCGWTHVDSVYHFNMMGMHSEVVNTLDDDWTMTNLTGTTCNFIDHNQNRDCRFTLLRK